MEVAARYFSTSTKLTTEPDSIPWHISDEHMTKMHPSPLPSEPNYVTREWTFTTRQRWRCEAEALGPGIPFMLAGWGDTPEIAEADARYQVHRFEAHWMKDNICPECKVLMKPLPPERFMAWG